jgi:hypothetical protein
MFSALPTFYMCSLKLPPQVIKQIDVYRKHCLWSKGDINRKGSCLAAWETACKPKTQGGLGIIDIKSQNDALLMKFLDKFFNHADVTWVTLTWAKFSSSDQIPPQARSPVGSFWWKEVLKLFGKFQALPTYAPNKGNTILFWSDHWLDQTLKNKFPQLFSFSKKPKYSRFFLDQDVNRLFSLPLCTQATD